MPRPGYNLRGDWTRWLTIGAGTPLLQVQMLPSLPELGFQEHPEACTVCLPQELVTFLQLYLFRNSPGNGPLLIWITMHFLEFHCNPMSSIAACVYSRTRFSLKRPKILFYIVCWHFLFRNVRMLSVANLPIEKLCIIKNFEEANFIGCKRLVKTLTLNLHKYSWPHKTCKPFTNKAPGSNWSVTVMRIEQSEVYDKVLPKH